MINVKKKFKTSLLGFIAAQWGKVPKQNRLYKSIDPYAVPVERVKVL